MSDLYNSKLVKLAAGTLTGEEAQDTRLKPMERSSLLRALALQSSGFASQADLDDVASRMGAEPIDPSKAYVEGELVFAEGESWRIAAGGANAGDLPSSHANKFIAVTPTATETSEGMVEFATQAEVNAGNLGSGNKAVRASLLPIMHVGNQLVLSHNGADPLDGLTPAGTGGVVWGSSNSQSGGNYSLVGGSLNWFCTANNAVTLGNDNNQNTGVASAIFGQLNASNSGQNTIIAGFGNSGNLGNQCALFGSGHTGNGGHYSLFGGEGHTGNLGWYSTLLGQNQNDNEGDFAILAGSSHGYNLGDYVALFGHGHSFNTGTHCVIGGDGNGTNAGNNTLIVGSGLAGNQGNNCAVFGISNANNTGDYSVIGGAGNASNAGGYAGLFGIGNSSNSGDNVLIAGKTNGSNSGHSVAIFGEGNSGNTGGHSVIGGSGHTANLGGYSAIFGESHADNSGTHALIAGANNHDNTGDYVAIFGGSNDSNSGDKVLIGGIGHDFNSGGSVLIWGEANRYNAGAYSLLGGSNNNRNSGDWSTVSGYSLIGNRGNHSVITGKGNDTSTGTKDNFSFTITAADNRVNSFVNGLADGDPIVFRDLVGGGAGLTEGVVYYVIQAGVVNFKVAATRGGSEVDITADYSGGGYIARACNYGDYNAIFGNNHHSTEGGYNIIAGGNNYGNTGDSNAIFGHSHNSNKGFGTLITGAQAADNYFSYARVHGGAGRAQISDVVVSKRTTDATPVMLTAGGVTAASDDFNLRLTPPNGASAFTVTLTCVDSALTNAKKFVRSGMILKNGTTMTLSTLTTIGADETIGTLAASFAITANGALECLEIEATGVAATTIDWTARVEFTQAG